MKIAIYGDSYTNLNLDQPNDGRGQSWVDIVKQHYDVTNFGIAGTSIYYSYLKFKEQNANFDYNIFIITHPDRIYNRKLNELIDRESWYTNYRHLELWSRQQNNTSHQSEIINSVRTYFKFWKDEETENDLNISLVENLMYRYNNCLFIYAFSKSHCPALKNEYGLVDITAMEQEKSGWIEKYSKNGFELGHLDENSFMLQDYRLNHLCEENNIILGNKILDAVNNRKTMLEINLKDFVAPKHNIDFYVRWNKKYGT